MPQSTIAKKRFFQWLEKSLGRAAVRNDYVPLEYTFRAMRIVTDEGDIGQVKLTPWQNADERVWMAFCTHNKELVLNIKRTGNDDSYRIDGHFERYFVMDLGMEINLDGSSENMLP